MKTRSGVFELRNDVKPSTGLLILILWLWTYQVFGIAPLVLEDGGISGIPVGDYLEFLSEEDLFPVISSDWSMEKDFKEKIASGHLSSDSRFLVDLEAVPGGYRYRMTLRESGRSTAAQWGIDDVMRPDVRTKFQPSTNEILRCDFTPHSCWLTFDVDNRSGDRREVFLELNKYLFSSLDVYYKSNGTVVEQRLNFTEPLSSRRVRNRNLTAVLDIPPGRTSVIMRVDSWFDDVVPLRLWSPDEYTLYLAQDNAILGSISGVFILLILYSLFVSFSAMNRSYLYLSALTLFTFVVHLAVSGFGFQHLWPSSPVVGIASFYGASSLSMIFTLLFCRNYIPENRRTLVLDGYILSLTGLIAGATVVMYAVPFGIQIRIWSYLFLLDHVYYLPLLIPAVKALRANDRSGAFLLTALVLYAVSQVEWRLTNRNVIPYALVNYLNVRSLLFVVLLAVGLHFKFRMMSDLVAGYRIRLDEISRKRSSKPVTDQAIRKTNQVKSFIEAHYREDISREGLASAVGMSPDHLSRMYKKTMGMTLAESINTLRIRDAARILLAEREQKIIDIAYTVGFNSLRTFNKVFVSTYQATPTEFRKQGQ